ncbi:NCAPH.2 family protein [Megaselia abdita]
MENNSENIPSLRKSGIRIRRSPINNDIAEKRRRVMEEDRSICLEDNETLKKCMQMFADNKMSKDNVWSLNIIDTLSNLMSNHNRALHNFKVAGSSLEASSRVYGLRVDCVHNDVLRLSHGLNKKKVMDIDAEPDIEEENESEEPTKKKKLKPSATVTKNKDTINGKFDTNPFADPFWGKLNSTNTPIQFLQNVLCSEGGGLKITSKCKYWDKEDSKEQSQDIRETLKADLLDCPKFHKIHLDDCVFRAAQTGYKISNIPSSFDELQKNEGREEMDIDEEVRTPAPQDNFDCMAMAFDMDSESQPLDTEDHNTLSIPVDSFNTEEKVALNYCKDLKKRKVIIEDLRPINSSIFEYSYRELQSIDRYWAGPSHWKFRKNMVSKESEAIIGQRKFKFIRNKTKKLNFTKLDENLFEELGVTKLKKTNLHNKWDARKLKLPTNYGYPLNFFDKLKLAPNLLDQQFRSEVEMEDHVNREDNFVNCSSAYVGESQSDFNEIPSSQDFHSDPNETIMEISDHFDGAPEKVTRIVVPFAKKAKLINMKQLKKCSLDSINDQLYESKEDVNLECYRNERYLPGTATFSGVYNELPKVLSKNLAENLSPSIALYSVLHLCNEHNFRIFPQEGLKDFKIRKLE